MPLASRLPGVSIARLLLMAAGLLSSGFVQLESNAAQVTFRWDYSASGAAGFVLYCGPSSKNYLTRVDVGNTETYTIGTLAQGATSFCAVTAYDPTRVESVFSNEVSVYVPPPAPVVSFSVSPASGTAPLSVAFTTTSTGQVSTWAWDFGDGTTSSVQNPSHLYTIPGSYTAVLTATGPGGTASSTAAIAIAGSVTSTVPPPATGLVAAYAFNETTGTNVADASGQGNTGTISGATRTTNGRFGGALSFNGVSDVVTVPDSASLHLTTGMTLAAWINPSKVSNAWSDVIYKGNDNYYLEATSDHDAAPSAGGTFSKIIGTGSLPANSWTHLAVTYDGAALRLYVNGTQVSSVAHAGSIATSTNPLQIGGDSIFGQYFQGRIDEVRVYNRALSQTEIQADMDTPIDTVDRH